MHPQLWKAVVALVCLAAVAAAGWRAGWVAADNRCRAREAERLAAEAQALEADRARARAVSEAYQKTAAELRRLQAAQRLEVQREVGRIEYRCDVPADGRVLLDAAQARAAAAASGSGSPVPGAPAP